MTRKTLSTLARCLVLAALIAPLAGCKYRPGHSSGGGDYTDVFVGFDFFGSGGSDYYEESYYEESYYDSGYYDGGYYDAGYYDGGFDDGGYYDGGYDDGGYYDDGGFYDDGSGDYWKTKKAG